MRKAVIIDLDNTLVDTAIRRHSILGSIFQNNPPSIGEVRSDFMLVKYLGDKESPTAMEFFSRLSSESGILENPAPLFDSAKKTINWLLNEDIEIIILSGRPERLLDVSKKELLSQGIEIDKLSFYFLPDDIDRTSPNYNEEQDYKYNKLIEIQEEMIILAYIGDQPTDVLAADRALVTPILFLGSCKKGDIDSLKRETSTGLQLCSNWLEVKKTLELLVSGQEEMIKLRDDFTDQYSKWLGDIDSKCRILATIAAALGGITGKLFFDAKGNYLSVVIAISFVLAILSMIYSIRSITSRYTSGRDASVPTKTKAAQFFGILLGWPKKWQFREGDAIDEYENLREGTTEKQRNSHLSFFYSRYGTYDPRSLKNLRMFELRATNYSKLYAERFASRTLTWSIVTLIIWLILSKI